VRLDTECGTSQIAPKTGNRIAPIIQGVDSIGVFRADNRVKDAPCEFGPVGIWNHVRAYEFSSDRPRERAAGLNYRS
jgi:hypothetical protein